MASTPGVDPLNSACLLTYRSARSTSNRSQVLLDQEYWFADSNKPATRLRSVIEHLRLIAVDTEHPIILDVDGHVMEACIAWPAPSTKISSSIRAVQFQVQPEPDYRNCRPIDLPYD